MKLPKRTKGSYNFSFEHDIEVELRIDVEGYVPERPAPPCSNHDSPAFSDSGDPGEIGDVKMFFVLKKKSYSKEKERMEVVENVFIPVPDPMVDFLLDYKNNNYGVIEAIDEAGSEESHYDYYEEDL